MRASNSFLLTALLLLAWPAPASDHKPPATEPATGFADCETHASENISIAAEPYETEEKQKIFRINYLNYGFLPIRIIVTNNSDKTLSLDEARIIFITADRIRVAAAEPEDIERRLTKPYGRNYPLPSPLPPIHTSPKFKEVTKIEQDFKDFEYSAAMVAPHHTEAGFLFYDVEGMKQSLAGAHLALRRLQWSPSGNELFEFDVAFDKYLDALKK